MLSAFAALLATPSTTENGAEEADTCTLRTHSELTMNALPHKVRITASGGPRTTSLGHIIKCCTLLVLVVCTVCLIVTSVIRGRDKTHGIPIVGSFLSAYGDRSEDWPSGQQICTHGLFRKYYKKFKYFPSGGRWSKVDRSGHYVMYRSSVCRLQYARLPPTFMKQCFAKAKVRSIVTVGDSNAQRYSYAVVQNMNGFSQRCRLVRMEDTTGRREEPEKSYFARYERLFERILATHYRYCGGCRAFQKECVWKLAPAAGLEADGKGGEVRFRRRAFRTTVEHLPMTMVLPTSLRFLVPLNFSAQGNISLWIHSYMAQSSAEFFFKYYLAGRYPDVLLVFLPFNHVKFFDPRRVRIDIQTFHELVRLYVPRTTKVVYVTTFKEFEDKKVDMWKSRKVDGQLASPRIDKLNHILFDVIKDDLYNGLSGIYSFFDMIDVSADRLEWSLDGIHMKPEWYENVIRNIMEVFCNSVLHDDF